MSNNNADGISAPILAGLAAGIGLVMLFALVVTPSLTFVSKSNSSSQEVGNQTTNLTEEGFLAKGFDVIEVKALNQPIQDGSGSIEKAPFKFTYKIGSHPIGKNLTVSYAGMAPPVGNIWLDTNSITKFQPDHITIPPGQSRSMIMVISIPANWTQTSIPGTVTFIPNFYINERQQNATLNVIMYTQYASVNIVK